MKFVLQVSTGGFAQCSVEDIRGMKEKLKRLLEHLPVSRIIFGWGAEPGLLEAIAELAHQYEKEALLWLPVFADIEHPDKADPLKPLLHTEKSAVQTYAGEEFLFMCPNSEKNLVLAVSSLEQLLGNVPADGVFLDRIRYPSAVFSQSDFFGCHCSLCRKLYQGAGIDTARLCQKASGQSDLRIFVPSSMEMGRYHYDDADLERLCEIKRRSIDRAVQKLANIFHQKGLSVGMDVFAPALADLVGQDLHSLSNTVDFLKPMMYYRTHAPAGISYELMAYGKAFSRRLAELWGFEPESSAGMRQQLLAIHGKAPICPGIEVNQIPGICDPRAEDYLPVLQAVSDSGCDEIVLSWNVLDAPEKNIAAIENAVEHWG